MNRRINQNDTNSTSALFIFVLIIIYASVLRITRAGYGLPYLYFIDDPYLVDVSIDMLENHSLNPRWMGFPGTIIMYILAMLYAVITSVYFLFRLWITKDVNSLNEFVEIAGKNWDFNPVVYHYTGRLFMAIVALSTIVAIFIFTRKRFGIWSAILASLCLSVSPLFLEHSTRVRPDIFASFMILLTLVFFVKFFENREKCRYVILAGLFCGFSVSAKYPSAVVFLPLAIGAIILDHQNVKIKFWAYMKSNLRFETALGKICLFAFIGFAISTPYFFLDFSKTINNLLFETKGGRFGVSRLPGIENHLWYFNSLVTSMGGWIVLTISLVGLIKVICEKKMCNCLFLSFPVLYFIFIGFTHLRWARWIIPILPFASILFGVGVTYITQSFIKVAGNKEKIVISIVAIICVCIFAPIIKQNIHSTITFINPDTRTLAKEWIEENIKEGSTVVCEIRSPQLWVNPLRKYEIINKGWDQVISEPLEAYQEIGADYIILSCSRNDFFKSQPDKYLQESERLHEISEKCLLIKEFATTDKNRGPIIKIYQVPKNITNPTNSLKYNFEFQGLQNG